MKTLHFDRFVLSCVIAALLAGCGAPQPPIGMPGAMPQSRRIATHAERGGSWMLPEAKTQDLLYIGNARQSESGVSVFSYPKGQLVGKLTGFLDPGGLCVDTRQHVFVSDGQTGEIVEFAHGGSEPIRTLLDTNQGPGGCSVDPKTGNLAVANITGSVSIYKDAKGTPEVYQDPLFVTANYCSYDETGTLFVDGSGYSQFTYYPAFALLSPTGNFKNISIDMVLQPGAVRWLGGYFAVGSGDGIDHVWIIHGYGVVRHVTPVLTGGVGDFWIQNKTLIDPSVDVAYYRYPKGGEPTKVIRYDVADPVAAAVSLIPPAPRPR